MVADSEASASPHLTPARNTYLLERAEVVIGQNTNRKKGHLLAKEGTGQNQSGHEKKASQQGALTN